MNKNSCKHQIKAFLIQIHGIVQGVGFRPFIYKHAKKYNLNGWVLNKNDCVEIKIEGSAGKIKKFIKTLHKDAPINSIIENIEIHEAALENKTDFIIVESRNESSLITGISPDIATCDECLNDMSKQHNRIGYPFVNCTNCGPRFTIIKDLPYDRINTTMDTFMMCQECNREYTDINDRRFHAQPVACNNCGPEYSMSYNNKCYNDINEIINIVQGLISEGKIIALKGIGGFNLLCDTFNINACERLRNKKMREHKPFAVMFKDIKLAKLYAHINKYEDKLLLSSKRPIVLLKEKQKISMLINSKLNTIGIMLPYMPIHYMLFESLKTCALVFTSGNISDEPIVIDNSEASTKLAGIYDAILTYNRDIYNRVDDSVSMVVNNKERIIRRSRGYVPMSVRLTLDVDGILALGGELKNTFCIGKDNSAFLSQHIGDLGNIEANDFYLETIDRFKNLLRVNPSLYVCDMHPKYFTTGYAKSLAALDSSPAPLYRERHRGEYKLIQVQHHHAHIASCMAENNIDEDVIGVSFDGTGYGDDGAIWGGEFLICSLDNYRRYTHFEYIKLQGGDKAIKEPWRIAISYLYKIYKDKLFDLNIPFLKSINLQDAKLIIAALSNDVNAYKTSSVGRLFDCVSALLDLCLFSTYEAEAPMKLEAILDDSCSRRYDYEITDVIKIDRIITGIINDLQFGINKAIISAKFHNTIIDIILQIALKIRAESNINKIALSGGIFQNRYILGKTEFLLQKNIFKVYSNIKVPANDGGLSLGQLAIAAKRRELGCV